MAEDTRLDKLQHFPDDSKHFIDHPSQAQPGIHAYPDKLYVLTMLENPLRHRSRYKNYWKFEKMTVDAGAILYTAEVALENRRFEITDPNNPRHLQMRVKSELWRKENALNILGHRLPQEAQKIAWIDSDIQFARADWCQETLQLLAHYDVLQMFSQVHNLGPDSTVITNRGSFMWNYIENRVLPHHADFLKPRTWDINGGSGYSGAGPGKWNHTGFAWAARKSALNTLGWLLDVCILGSADYHMATALVGEVERSINSAYPIRYKELILEWAHRADKIRLNPEGGVGYMPGAILHDFHGTTKNRIYEQRWKLLAKTQFNPDTDIRRDHNGLWQLDGRNVALRDGVRMYNRLRNEDSTDTTGMI